MHGIVLTNREGRLKQGLDEHFREHRNLYQTQRMYRIDVKPIRSDAWYVTDYGGKAIKNSRFSTDHILILPKSTSELARGRLPVDPAAAQCRTSSHGTTFQTRLRLRKYSAWTDEGCERPCGRPIHHLLQREQQDTDLVDSRVVRL
jgi:hypothetical protein